MRRDFAGVSEDSGKFREIPEDPGGPFRILQNSAKRPRISGIRGISSRFGRILRDGAGNCGGFGGFWRILEDLAGFRRILRSAPGFSGFAGLRCGSARFRRIRGDFVEVSQGFAESGGIAVWRFAGFRAMRRDCAEEILGDL